ncbi:hypothetical protein [Nocardia asteroides]|uniref:hypothetical protein n=1 Tax=Nocardia asteroides TaxID=1824 RepID=UPI001E3120F0|nr:hypothetical protein [Nocardia asteroides]UGT60890.1 hypothetical protein LTT61_27690 [Nocardia asteroides]
MSDKVVVSLDLMQHAVRKWEEAAHHFELAATKAMGLNIAENKAGAFALALDNYRPAPGYFTDRMREGRALFSDIADVLQQAHDSYRANEEAGAHAIQNTQGPR